MDQSEPGIRVKLVGGIVDELFAALKRHDWPILTLLHGRPYAIAHVEYFLGILVSADFNFIFLHEVFILILKIQNQVDLALFSVHAIHAWISFWSIY